MPPEAAMGSSARVHIPKGIKDVLGNQAVWEEICQVRWPSLERGRVGRKACARRVNGEGNFVGIRFVSIVRWSSTHTGLKRGVSFVWYVQAVWRATVQADSVGRPPLMNGKPFPSSSGRHHGMCRLESDACMAKAVRPLKRIRSV